MAIIKKNSKQKCFNCYVVLILFGGLKPGCKSFLSKVCFSIEGKRLHGKKMILMSEFMPNFLAKMGKWEMV